MQKDIMLHSAVDFEYSSCIKCGASAAFARQGSGGALMLGGFVASPVVSFVKLNSACAHKVMGASISN